MPTEKNQFHTDLYRYIDDYVHRVYTVTKTFPKDEQFGLTSQLRRSAISVMLNYVEGYARQRNAVYKNFLEISYGSLKESQYLLQFTGDQKYLSKKDSDD